MLTGTSIVDSHKTATIKNSSKLLIHKNLQLRIGNHSRIPLKFEKQYKSGYQNLQKEKIHFQKMDGNKE